MKNQPKTKAERKQINFHKSVLGSKEEYANMRMRLLLMGYRWGYR